jgi:hypothetical protein
MKITNHAEKKNGLVYKYNFLTSDNTIYIVRLDLLRHTVSIRIWAAGETFVMDEGSFMGLDKVYNLIDMEMMEQLVAIQHYCFHIMDKNVKAFDVDKENARCTALMLAPIYEYLVYKSMEVPHQNDLVNLALGIQE